LLEVYVMQQLFWLHEDVASCSSDVSGTPLSAGREEEEAVKGAESSIRARFINVI